MAKLDSQHVPHRDASQVITDLLGNPITMYFGKHRAARSAYSQGRLRGLAVTSRERFPTFPELSTMAESGFPGYDVTATFGLMTATGTPADVIDRISATPTRRSLRMTCAGSSPTSV